jgi:urea transport system permease protein
VLVNFGKSIFTGILPEVWLFALGALFILVTLLLPKGIIGAIRRRERQLPVVTPTPEPAE